MIDWQRLAQPQPDGFDSETVLTLCAKPLPRFPDDPFTFCDGLVAIRLRGKQTAPYLTDGPCDHPNIRRAENLLKLWPEGYRCFTNLINVFYPLSDNDKPDFVVYGSTCGSDESEWGAIYATVYSDLGLAEALVHECGHQKLRGLGILLETHDGRLIANLPRELYSSPIRKDKLRPMSAVLHASYSYSAVLNLDVAIAESGFAHPHIRTALEVNTARMREGRETLREHLRPTDEGQLFFTDYFAWLNSVIDRAERILNERDAVVTKL